MNLLNRHAYQAREKSVIIALDRSYAYVPSVAPTYWSAERQRELERRNEAESKARTLRGKVITVKAKAGAQGRLYGSITGQEVADALNEQYQVNIDKRKIELNETIRTVGEYEAIVKLYPEITGKINLVVTEA